MISNLYCYSRLFNWFDLNIGKYTISYSYTSTFVGYVVCIPFIVSILFLSIDENKINNKFYDIFINVIKIYNILCFLYCLFDRKLELISEFLVYIAEYIVKDGNNVIANVFIIILSMIIFGIYDRFKNRS